MKKKKHKISSIMITMRAEDFSCTEGKLTVGTRFGMMTGSDNITNVQEYRKEIVKLAEKCFINLMADVHGGKHI